MRAFDVKQVSPQRGALIDSALSALVRVAVWLVGRRATGRVVPRFFFTARHITVHGHADYEYHMLSSQKLLT